MPNQENSSENLWQDNAPAKNTNFLGIKPNASFFTRTTSAILANLEAHEDFIGGLYVTQKHLFTTSEDGYFKIWNRENLEIIEAFEGISTNNVKVSPCQKYVATADDNHVVKIYTISSDDADNEYFELLHVLYGHQGYVSRLIFADEKLISCSQDGNVMVWSYKTGELLATLEGHEEWVYALAVSPDNKKLMSAALNSTLKLWNLDTYEFLLDVTEGSTLVYVMGMTIGGGNAGDKGNANAVHEIAWISEKRVITMAQDLVMWDTDTWEVLWQVNTGNQYDLKSSAYIPAFDLLITVGDVIEGWNVNTGEQIFAEVGHEGAEMYSCFYFFEKENQQKNQPEKHLLYTADKNGLLKIWSVNALMAGGVKQEHSNSINEVKYVRETQVLMSSSYDDSIIIWDKNMAVIERIRHQSGGAANFLATVPQNPHQLVWAWQGKIIIYDTKEKKIIAEFPIISNLVHYDNGIFINENEILCFTLCYLPRILNIKTKIMTILELPFTLTDYVPYTPSKILLKTYPMSYLDNKEELYELREQYAWKALFSEREMKERLSKESKSSPFLVFDTAKLEIEKSFDAPESLVFKDQKYACEILKINEKAYLVNYTNAVSVIWDIETSEILHTIQTNEEYINFIFANEQYFYHLGKSGNLGIFDKITFEAKQVMFLGDDIIKYLFCEEKNLFFYANKQGEIFGMDMNTQKNTIYANTELDIRVMSFCDDMLFIGTEGGKVLSMSLV